MASWKTTLGGLIGILPLLLKLFGVHLTPEELMSITAIGVGIIGAAAKDSNVTGGTKPQ